MYQVLVDLAERKEDILADLLNQFGNGTVVAKDLPMALDEKLTKMFDEVWIKSGLEEEEIFNDFYDHKCSFNARYIEIKDASWRRLAKKISP